MATNGVNVSVLDVGQGQGTFVEVYDASDNLTNTLLFDLGSAKSSRTAGSSSIDYIATKIASMAIPKIDYLSLSHKDRDHVNLLKRLIDAIHTKIAPNKLQIGKVRYGGAREWYSGDLIKVLEGVSSDVSSLNLRHTCYIKGPPEKWEAIWNENDVYVYIMLANIPTDSTLKDWSQVNVIGKPDSELANSVSIISTVRWNNTQFFINGDATFVTFEESNKIFSFLTTFDYVKMVTLPHHGSRRTTFGLSSSTYDATTAATAVVDTFAKKINAKTVTVSAEIFGTYHHPSYDVMGLFTKYTDSTPWFKDPNLAGNRHYITAYLDVTTKDSKGVSLSGEYSSFESPTNVYTTLYAVPGYIHGYSIPPPNPVGPGTKWLSTVKKPVFPIGVQWTYTINANGVITLTSPANRQPSVMALKNDTVTDTQAMVEVPTEETQILSRNNTIAKVRPAIGANGKILKHLKVFR